MSTDDFQYVKIPEGLKHIFGTPDAGTHIYRRDGPQEESSAWFDALCEVVGPTVSPGGAGMYCPVSRAAVHKRVKEGKLTMFLFHVTHRRTTLFGQNKILRETPYGYIPVSELQAWRKELEERAVKQGNITVEDLAGSRPDWEGDFLSWKNKNERLSLVDELIGVDGDGGLAEAIKNAIVAKLRGRGNNKGGGPLSPRIGGPLV
ncbi:MAG: hypothetical protein WC360_04320 [Opitutales bacterium]|jgi:hypothetical protein